MPTLCLGIEHQRDNDNSRQFCQQHGRRPPGLPGGNTRIVDFLGGSSTVGFASDVNNERRTAINTIPRLWEFAYWDPSGTGDDFDYGDGNAFSYHNGRQIQYESKFSELSAAGNAPPNGTISPANLDSLGAKWSLDTGLEVAQSGQGAFRITDSGSIGLRIDPTNAGDIVEGQKFHLEMTLPEGHFLVSLFQENKTRNAYGAINFHDVAEVVIPPLPADGDDDHAVQFEVINDSGGEQVLHYNFGDLAVADNVTDLDIRFSAAFIQRIPEPSSFVLGLLGTALIGRRRRK